MKNVKIIKLSLLFLALVIVFEVTSIVMINVLKENLSFELLGQKSVILGVGDVYNDSGYNAHVFDWDINGKVQVDSNLDTEVIGDYHIKYILPFFNEEYHLERNIEVVDNIPPTIELVGDSEIKLYTNDEYHENGAIANDNYDGDISDKIKIESNLDVSQEGEYAIKYVAYDSSGNRSDILRKIIIEKKPEPKPAPIVYQPSAADHNIKVPLTSGDPIADYVVSHDYDVSIGYYNLATGKQYFYQADKLYYGASLIKTLDAVYLYDKNMVNNDIKNYIDRAISVSDNDAHIYLINYIGRDALKQYGISLGAPNTLSYEGSNYGDTTVSDQLAYYKKAYEIAKNNNDFKSPFVNDFYNYIKINGLTTMHKHGYYDEWYHDAGIIFDTEPYIVVILTRHGRGNRYEVIHNLTNLIYRYHKGEL